MERRTLGEIAVVVAVIALLLAAGRDTPAHASDLLSNGGFESWNGSTPAGWNVTGGAASAETAGATGTALRIESDGVAMVRQTVPVLGGATYTAGLLVAAASGAESAEVILAIGFRDSLGVSAALRPAISTKPMGGFEQLSLVALAPSNAVTAELHITVQGGGPSAVVLDSATFVESAPPPPPTDTPTSSPTVVTATPTTTTPAPTATSSPTSAPTSAPTTPPPASKTPTATKTASPAPTSATGTATSKPPSNLPPGMPSGFGGLIANGDFELPDGDGPAYWSKVGGELAVETEAYRGNAGGALDSSSSSTKWMYQVVGVTGGTWYTASGFGRVRWGAGEVWIRVSWYSSGDGSGPAMDQADSNIVTRPAWQGLETGAILAPGGANSARVRLMLRPEPGFASAAFDDVVFAATAGPTPSPTPATATGTTAPVQSMVTPAPGTPATNSATASPRTGPASTGGGLPAPATGPAFVVQPAAGPLSLRLSEVLADPAQDGRDSPYEWVEFVNAGSEPVDISGWSLGDATAMDVLPAAQIAPGGFIVVAGSGAAFADGVSVVRVPDGDIGNGLNNGGDAIRLVAPDGTEVDSLSFGDNRSVFDPAPPAPDAGGTLGVIAAGTDPAPENWAVTLRPTPGQANVFPAPPTLSATAQPAQSVASGPAAQGLVDGSARDIPVEDDDGGTSAIPWMVLGAFGAVGAMGIASSGRRLYHRRKAGLRGGD